MNNATHDRFEFTAINSFLEMASPDEVVGCPNLLVLKHIRRKLADFCKRTQWLRSTLDPIRMVKEISEYELDDVPDDLKFGSILWLQIDGNTLLPREYTLSDGGGAVILAAVPTEADEGKELIARVVLEPTPECARVEKDLFERWGYAISAGALADLRRIPTKKWTNLELSAFNTQEYENGVTAAKNEVNRARKNETLIMSARKFAI